MKTPRTTIRMRMGHGPNHPARWAGHRLWFLLPLLVVVATASAQVEIIFDPFTVDSGGGTTSSGGTYAISGTAGQPEAGRMSGGPYVISGGFWHGVAASNQFYVSYAAWAGTKGLGTANNGLTQDPDSDGISNLMEFYFDGNPLAGDPSILPTSIQEGGYLILSFKRRDDAELGLKQAVQFSATMNVWTTSTIGAASSPADGNGVIVTVSENGASPDDVTVKIPLTHAVAGKLFVRLQLVN